MRGTERANSLKRLINCSLFDIILKKNITINISRDNKQLERKKERKERKIKSEKGNHKRDKIRIEKKEDKKISSFTLSP